MNTKIKYKGFTLIELMISVALVAILAMLAGPGVRELIMNNRVAAVSEELMGALNFSRAESIKRNGQVSICKSDDGATCDATLNWDDGWIVFTDIDGDGIVDVGVDGDVILQTGGDFTADYTIRSIVHGDWVAFRSDGSSIGNGGLATGIFRVCNPEEDIVRAKSIEITVTGRPRMYKGAVACP
jgi:type IV fimbrial biogenesis protein FimT